MKTKTVSIALVVMLALSSICAASTGNDIAKAKQYSSSHPGWRPGVMSGAANFECDNTVLNYHIVNTNTVKLRFLNGKVTTTTFKKMNSSPYEFFFFITGKEKFKTDGSINGNLGLVQELYRKGKL